MNYLAHAFLSPNDPHILTGNVVTDMLKGPVRNEIDIRFLSSGIYFLDLQTEQGIIVKKFIKE